jgi:hypothetical protein
MTYPFRIVPPSALFVAGYTWSTIGVFPIHRLDDGRYLRRTRCGWTKRPEALVPAALFGTAKAASAARDRFMLQLRRRAQTDRRAA